MKRTLQEMLARIEASRKGGAKSVWYIVFTDTLLDVLQTQSIVTHEDMRAALQSKLDINQDNELLRIAYEEALRALDEHWPK